MNGTCFSVLCYRFLAVATLGLASTNTLALQVPGPLVDAGWLAEHQGEVVILDIRRDAKSYAGTPTAPGTLVPARLVGHIPAAVSVPWKRVVAKGDEQGAPLKAMLPAAEAFRGLMRASGVRNDSAVVIAGRGATAKDQAYAARLYFTLKYYGHDNVALLDGGTAQWAAQGRPLSGEPELPTPGDFEIKEVRGHLILDTGEVENAIRTGGVQLVDCRTEDFYLGLRFKRKFVSPEHKGHLPGSETLPFVLIADNSGPARLFSERELRDVAALKGVDLEAPTILYCNTGVTASLGWFALHELLGNRDARLYDGSMHAWSALDPSPRVVALAPAAAGPGDDESVPAVETSGVRETEAWPPVSLQSLVDERRDALRQRRERQIDAVTGRRWFQPAWVRMRSASMDRYGDEARAAQRARRDAMRHYRDTLLDLRSPWSRHVRERAEIRRIAAQMDRLDRQERPASLRFSHQYIPRY
jgi:thiosulfate/3-mercaptopyruvate sulfurtransferase